MTFFRRLSRFVDLLPPVGYIAASAGLWLWIILCVQDGFARPISTSPAITGRSFGSYPFDTSATTGKTAGLIIFGLGALTWLIGVILQGRSAARYKSSHRRTSN